MILASASNFFVSFFFFNFFLLFYLLFYFLLSFYFLFSSFLSFYFSFLSSFLLPFFFSSQFSSICFSIIPKAPPRVGGSISRHRLTITGAVWSPARAVCVIFSRSDWESVSKVEQDPVFWSRFHTGIFSLVMVSGQREMKQHCGGVSPPPLV